MNDLNKPCSEPYPPWLCPHSSMDTIDDQKRPHPFEAFSLLCSSLQQKAATHCFEQKENPIIPVQLPLDLPIATTETIKPIAKLPSEFENNFNCSGKTGTKEPNLPTGSLKSSGVNFYFEKTPKSSHSDYSKQEFTAESMLIYYKEKCVKLECELAKLRRKWDVLSEKYDYFSEVVATSNQTVTEYMNQLKILTKQNQEFENEAAHWKKMCLKMQRYSPEEIPSKRASINALFYQDIHQPGSCSNRNRKGLLIQDPSELANTTGCAYETTQQSAAQPKVFPKVIKGTHWYFEHDIRKPDGPQVDRHMIGKDQVRFSD